MWMSLGNDVTTASLDLGLHCRLAQCMRHSYRTLRRPSQGSGLHIDRMTLIADTWLHAGILNPYPNSDCSYSRTIGPLWHNERLSARGIQSHWDREVCMRKANMCRNVLILLFVGASCASLALAQGVTNQEIQVTNTGISGLWVLANISYAGMRAQNNSSKFWRVLAFIFGLPATIVTLLA